MQYIKECLQLLYWIYFKPYTLKQHVREICPEITNPYEDNIYRRSAEARANPQLKRYDDQGWWLTALAPMVSFIIYALLVKSASQLISDFGVLKSNNMTMISYFFLGWLLGQIIVWVVQRKIGKKYTSIVAIAAIILFFSFTSLFWHNLVSDPFISQAVRGTIGGMVLSVMGGVVLGVAVKMMLKEAEGVALGVAFSVPVSVALGVAFSVLISEAGNVAMSVAIGVAVGVSLGVAVGMAVSMAVGVALGIAVAGVIGISFGMIFGISLIFGVLRLYFWLPELLWLWLLKTLPLRPIARLSVLPPQFDQLIILPLPFLPGLIAEAYRENQAAARQTLDYLITSTNQQKVAGKAIIAITVEEFRRCRTADDIAALREQLDWLPAKFARQQLQDCLEISQDVSSALEASSVFRQEQRLEQVCGKIVRLRTGLAIASARQATTFGGVLDHWLRLIETARCILRESAQRSEEIPQVYLAGPALDPNRAGSLFKGRSDLFRHIESLLLSAQPPTLVMHGGRRSGKSSALRYLPKQMPADILPLFVDCQGAAVSSSLHGLADRIANQLISSARETHRLTLPPPDKEELRLDPFAALLAWLDTAEQAVPGKTFLLCLDEFERIDEIVTTTGSRAPLNFLRHLIQHRRRWLLLFAGAHTPEELSLHWSDCLINTRSLRVSCLDKDDALELIRRPVEDFPDIWQDAAAEAVWQLTQGQPYCIQLIGQEVIERLNKQKRRLAEAADVEAVLPTVFERGSEFFLEFWRSRSREEQTLLAALAQGESITPEMNAATAALVRKEILAQETFKVPLMGRWISVHASKNHFDDAAESHVRAGQSSASGLQ